MISVHVTLVQLIYTVGNINLTVSIDVNWIYDYNNKRDLPLIKLSLDVICSPSKDDDDMYSYFKVVFYAVSYGNPK